MRTSSASSLSAFTCGSGERHPHKHSIYIVTFQVGHKIIMLSQLQLPDITVGLQSTERTTSRTSRSKT